jgi:antitoxin VapB
MQPAMPINVNNPEADALTRRFAAMTGMGITEAIVVAMSEAIARRRTMQTPLETAARLREKHRVVLGTKAPKPLPGAVFDAMWGDKPRDAKAK